MIGFSCYVNIEHFLYLLIYIIYYTIMEELIYNIYYTIMEELIYNIYRIMERSKKRDLFLNVKYFNYLIQSLDQHLNLNINIKFNDKITFVSLPSLLLPFPILAPRCLCVIKWPREFDSLALWLLLVKSWNVLNCDWSWSLWHRDCYWLNPATEGNVIGPGVSKVILDFDLLVQFKNSRCL